MEPSPENWHNSYTDIYFIREVSCMNQSVSKTTLPRKESHIYHWILLSKYVWMNTITARIRDTSRLTTLNKCTLFMIRIFFKHGWLLYETFHLYTFRRHATIAICYHQWCYMNDQREAMVYMVTRRLIVWWTGNNLLDCIQKCCYCKASVLFFDKNFTWTAQCWLFPGEDSGVIL